MRTYNFEVFIFLYSKVYRYNNFSYIFRVGVRILWTLPLLSYPVATPPVSIHITAVICRPASFFFFFLIVKGAKILNYLKKFYKLNPGPRSDNLLRKVL